MVDLGAQVVSLRRSGGRPAALEDDLMLQGGDTLVLSGTSEALALAESVLLTGS